MTATDSGMDGDISAAGSGGAAEAPPKRRRFADRFRIAIACVAFVAWLLITALIPASTRHSHNIVDALTGGLQWGIVFAGLFLILLTALCRWGDLGLRPPAPARSLLLLWLPAIYLLLFLAADVAVLMRNGPLPAAAVGFLALNAALAAFSEELMFRGVLFGALRTRLRPWTAIAVTTVLFGLTHLLNAVAFGSLPLAAAQAVAAAMSGLLFIAIRVRTGSLLPAMVYHGLWDFGTLVLVAGALAGPGASGASDTAAAAAELSPAMLLGPIILLLPNFAYALFLLRPRKAATA